ncbi:hypothetical protein [Paraburkholderia unamae]|uniref:Uncharacterized protein n=1 Tax=Paraburkholderia unamae TaxID=219649 RepID=A0ACC6RPX0_9BURK
MTPSEARQFMGVVAQLISEHVSSALAPFGARIASLEERAPLDGRDGKDGEPGRDGRDGIDGKDGGNGTNGIDGKDGTPGRDGVDGAAGADGVAGRDGIDGRNGADGAAGRDGIDGAAGRDGVDGERGADGRDGVDGERGADGRDGVDGERGADGRDGIDGAPGRDGIDGRDGEPGKDGAPGANGRDGRDGKDGRDGAPGRDGIDGRDAAEIVVLDGIDAARTYARGTFAWQEGGLWRAEAKTDGMTGWRCVMNGTAAVDVIHDGERAFSMLVHRTDGTVEPHPFTLPVALYRGVYEQGRTYEPGDIVTWAGSMWHCNATTTDKPDAGSGAWTLAVKRGRDGRDGGRS